MKILQFIQEDNGQLSSTRLLFVVWGFTLLGIWAYLSVAKGAIQPIDVTVVGAFSSLGLVKVAQKYGEKPGA